MHFHHSFNFAIINWMRLFRIISYCILVYKLSSLRECELSFHYDTFFLIRTINSNILEVVNHLDTTRPTIVEAFCIIFVYDHPSEIVVIKAYAIVFY